MARLVLLDRCDGTWRAAHETPERRVAVTARTPLQALGELHAALRARRQALDNAIATIEAEGVRVARGEEIHAMLECADERDHAPMRPDFTAGVGSRPC